MTKLDAFDYSFDRPDIPAMAAAGVKAVSRYLWDSGPGNKGISRAERLALLAAGIAIVYNYEAQRGNHLKGADQGKQDGAAARQFARAIGVPAGTPIFYSCDLEVSAADMPAVLAYLRAADHPDYPSRAYAQFSVGESYRRPFWQTVAWSGGQLSKLAVLYQYEINKWFGGAAVDHDTILDAEHLGAEWPAGHEPVQEFTLDAAAAKRLDQLETDVRADVAACTAAVADLRKFVHDVLVVTDPKTGKKQQLGVDTIVARRLGPLQRLVAALKPKR